MLRIGEHLANGERVDDESLGFEGIADFGHCRGIVPEVIAEGIGGELAFIHGAGELPPEGRCGNLAFDADNVIGSGHGGQHRKDEFVHREGIANPLRGSDPHFRVAGLNFTGHLHGAAEILWTDFLHVVRLSFDVVIVMPRSIVT